MMNGERRAVAVNLTNAAESDARVTVHIDGLAAAGRDAAWIDAYGIQGTDTRQNVLQSDMLVPLAKGPGGYGLTVPAGATQQLWLRFCPFTLVPGGTTALVLRISSGGVSHNVPVTLAISRYPFPAKLALSFGDPWIGEVSVKLFKSTVGNINPANVNVVNALLKDYQVDISGETLNVLTPGDAFRSAEFHQGRVYAADGLLPATRPLDHRREGRGLPGDFPLHADHRRPRRHWRGGVAQRSGAVCRPRRLVRGGLGEAPAAAGHRSPAPGRLHVRGRAQQPGIATQPHRLGDGMRQGRGRRARTSASPSTPRRIRRLPSTCPS